MYRYCFFLTCTDHYNIYLEVSRKAKSLFTGLPIKTGKNEKSAQRDANTARRPPVRCHKPTDRTEYNTLRRSWLARSVKM